MKQTGILCKSLVLSAVLVGLAVDVWAVNPFSDVSADSWAYRSVHELYEAGVITGYPDKTFRGDRPMTRYETAQMVARGLANRERADAEQQALLNRLSDEFGDELNRLGVRVASLEDRAGNVKVSGDFRLNIVEKEGIDDYDSGSLVAYRGRFNIDGNVNKKTKVRMRLTTGNIEFGGGERSSNLKFDLAYVDHTINDRVKLNIGRYTQRFGDGLIYSSNFDGIGVTWNNGPVRTNMAYGYMTAGRANRVGKGQNGEVALVNVEGDLNAHVTVGGMWARVGKNDIRMGNGLRGNEYRNIGGVYTRVKDDKFGVHGEYVKAAGISHSDVWKVGVQWGRYAIGKKNSWSLGLDYFDQARNAPVFKTQKYETNDLQKNVRHDGYRAWQASGSYALAHNVGINAYYGFRGRTHNGAKVNNYTRINVLYKF